MNDNIKWILYSNVNWPELYNKDVKEVINIKVVNRNIKNIPINKRIFLNKLEYISPFNNIIFDDYVFSVDGHGGLEINVPSYYIFDINKIKYQIPRLKLLRYYLPPARWNSYREEDVLPYDSFAEKVDETARKRISTIDATDRNIDNYNLQSINLYARELSEVSDGYIYIFGMQVVNYRDR
mgnify:CR=1 FL=1